MEITNKWNDLDKSLQTYVPHVRRGVLSRKDFDEITELKKEELILGITKEKLYSQPSRLEGFVSARRRVWKENPNNDMYDIIYTDVNGKEVFLRQIKVDEQSSKKVLSGEVNLATDIFDAGVYEGQDRMRTAIESV